MISRGENTGQKISFRYPQLSKCKLKLPNKILIKKQEVPDEENRQRIEKSEANPNLGFRETADPRSCGNDHYKRGGNSATQGSNEV